MKANLIKTLEQLRIDAVCDVLELGDYDISKFAYERTVQFRRREQVTKLLDDQKVLRMPSYTEQVLNPKPFVRKQSVSERVISGLKIKQSDRLEVPLVPLFENPMISKIKAQEPARITDNSISMTRNLERMNTSVKLNNLMKANSGADSNCKLIFTNLPSPGLSSEGLDDGEEWIDYINVLTEALPRVVLIKGTGEEVVTTFF